MDGTVLNIQADHKNDASNMFFFSFFWISGIGNI